MEDFYERASLENFTQIIGTDARTIDNIVESNTVTCIVTSPPYPNAIDYHREHKSNLLWLGLPFRNFQSREIGSHSKFASNRLRMLSQYLSDMIRASMQMARVLKPNKYCCVVIGNSSVEHLIIENHQFLKKAGEFVGLDFEYEVLRNIDKTRKSTSDIAMCVKKMMINFREDFAAGKTILDTKVLRYSLRRFFKGQNLTLEEGGNIYRQRNLEKLDEAIANVEQDIFKAG
jgi:tRNA G10  N-methylase Trm11